MPLLSDESLQLTRLLRLPTFETAGMRLYRRMTMIIADATRASVASAPVALAKPAPRGAGWVRLHVTRAPIAILVSDATDWPKRQHR